MTKKLPHYRFQGYTDAWELRKLSEFVSFYNGLTYSPNDVNENGTLVLRSSNVKDGEVVVADNVYVDTEKVTSENVKVGDIVVVVRNGSKALIGKHAVIKESMPNTVIGAFMSGIRTDIPFFVNALLDTKWFEKEIEKNMGATINQITGYMFSNMEFIIPSIAEQSAIGTFFSTLDQHITLHQRKLDTLKEQKKTYLKLLFPAKGQTKPALRFQGFEDDWEEVKLGDVLVEYNRKSEIENQFELLSSTNSGIEPRSGRVSGESNIGYKIIKKGMVVLSPQNLWLGNINYNAKFEIGIVSPSYKVFNIDGPNELFLATVLRLPQMFFEYAQASVQGASIVRRNLDLDLFSTIAIPLPSLPEQEVIGTFFQTLDQEIAQVEDKLASLKEMKKTLLRKLFVS